MTELTEDTAIDTPEEAATDHPGDLSRPQKRLLKRLYNARTVPVMADERPFLTYREAARYLLKLDGDARESAYAQMKAHVRDKVR